MRRTEEGGQEGRDRWVRHGSCGGNGYGRVQRMVWFGQAHGWGGSWLERLKGPLPNPYLAEARAQRRASWGGCKGLPTSVGTSAASDLPALQESTSGWGLGVVEWLYPPTRLGPGLQV